MAQMKSKFLYRLGNALKAFSGITSSLPFSLTGWRTNLRTKSVESDPAGSFAGWVYAAIDKRAKRVGAIELHLYELDRKMDISEIYDHDLLSLLYRANPMQTQYQLFYTIEMMLGIWGSAPVYKDRAGGTSIQYLWPLRPDLLKAITNNAGKIISYEYRIGSRVEKFPFEDVVVINEPSPLSIATGNSPLLAAGLEVDADMQAALWNKYLIENFSEPGGVLTTEQNIDDKSFERLKKEWAARHQGATNAGRWALLEKGLKAEPIGRSPQEMDLVENRKFHRSAITSILGVPISLLAPEDSNLANSQSAERILAKDTIEPEMKLIVGIFNEFLVPEYADNLELDFESPVPDDVQQNINLAVAGEGRYLTVNEARDIFDYGPIEGGDAIYKPLGVYPQVGNPAGSNDPMNEPPKGYPKDAKFEKLAVVKSTYKKDKKLARIKSNILARTRTKRKIVEGVASKVSQKLLEKVSAAESAKVVGFRIVEAAHSHSHPEAKAVDDGSEMDPRLKMERLEFLKRLPRQQKKFTVRMQGFFEQQQKEVFKNLEEEGLPKGRGDHAPAAKSISRWINKIIFDKKQNDDLLVQMAGDMYRDNIQTGSQAVASLLGIDASNVLATPFVVDFIQDRSFLMLSVNKTTEDALRATLSDGVAQGEDLGQIRNRISDVYNEAQDFRAETIARTEVGAAQNFGRSAEMENQGVKKKVWIAIFSNTRDAHAEADGQIVPVDEAFNVGGERLEYPGDPAGSPENTINCQCSVSPTLG